MRAHAFVGKTGIGKTQIAFAHFCYPLNIHSKEEWRRFKPGMVEGNVLNNLNFYQWEGTTLLKHIIIEDTIAIEAY